MQTEMRDIRLFHFCILDGSELQTYDVNLMKWRVNCFPHYLQLFFQDAYSISYCLCMDLNGKKNYPPLLGVRRVHTISKKKDFSNPMRAFLENPLASKECFWPKNALNFKQGYKSAKWKIAKMALFYSECTFVTSHKSTKYCK